MSAKRRIGASHLAWSLALLAVNGSFACGGNEASMARSPVGAAGGGTGGAGAPAGQGGMAGAAGSVIAGSGGMILPPTGGTGGAGGMIGSGGAGGIAGMAGSGGSPAGSGGAGGGGSGGASGAGTGGSGGSAPSGDLCARWNEAHANLDEGAWNGNTASCEPGTLSEETLQAAHTLHSLFRTMAGLEPVEMTAEGNELAQACALLMTANGTITHSPPASFDCYTQEAADTAATSSLSTGSALESVDGYMIDPGNPTTIGHRRWILSNMLASVGFGSTGNFSCQYQPATRPAAGAKAWVAWPPPGQIPIDAFGTFFAKLDETGWTVQSDTIDLGGAGVTVTSDGAELDVSVTQLSGGYGSRYALRFNPSGWATAAGKTYSVKLSGTSTAIEYDVVVVDCP